jgi:maleate cis-trans isomerase
MFGWRAKIGLIKPTHKGKAFQFWYKRAPDGVELVPTFFEFKQNDHATFESAFPRIEQISADLKENGCTLISLAGTPPALLKGYDFEREWGDRLSQKLGIPVMTQMEPHAQALVALGAKRVAVATYYGDELNNAIVGYLKRFDIEGVLLGPFGEPEQQDGLYGMSRRALDDVSHIHVYRYCRSRCRKLDKPVDAIYINGGGWDSEPAIELLERDLHTKVVTNLSAELWATYQKAGVDFTDPELGVLLRDNPALPPRR